MEGSGTTKVIIHGAVLKSLNSKLRFPSRRRNRIEKKVRERRKNRVQLPCVASLLCSFTIGRLGLWCGGCQAPWKETTERASQSWQDPCNQPVAPLAHHTMSSRASTDGPQYQGGEKKCFDVASAPGPAFIGSEMDLNIVARRNCIVDGPADTRAWLAQNERAAAGRLAGDGERERVPCITGCRLCKVPRSPLTRRICSPQDTSHPRGSDRTIVTATGRRPGEGA